MEASVSSSVDDDFPPEARSRCYTWPMQQFVYENPGDAAITSREPTVAQLLAATPCSSAMGSHLMPLHLGGMPPQLPLKKKRCRKKPTDQLAQKKPNPWGEESYSDLIAKALESAPDGRLKLNEIYQWFSDNISYFRERSSQEEAAGWKNSIRHNLSLHSRFMRIQNEGAGKSSWWVINPDAKPGRNPRRRATMENTSKSQIEKKRRGARKNVDRLRGMMPSGPNSMNGSAVSITSHDLGYPEDGFDPMFRPRTVSTLTNPSRVSPSMEGFNDFDFPPWIDAANGAPPIPSDIVDRTEGIRLDQPCDPNSPAFRRTMLNGLNGDLIKQELKPVKMEEGLMQPPSYHELNSVRSPNQLQNPLLRGQLSKLPTAGAPYGFAPYAPWAVSGTIPPLNSCASQQAASAGTLPVDLENLTLPDQPLMEMDMEAVLRHELSQTTNNQLNFDI